MNYPLALQTLQLTDPPTAVEIKTAFHRQALQHHPDRNPDDAMALRRFQEANQAYQFLVQHPETWLPTPEKLAVTRAKISSEKIVEDLEDIFFDIFGFSEKNRILGFHAPQDLICDLVTLCHGGRRKYRLNTHQRCGQCQGLGSPADGDAKICTYCFGQGRIYLSGPNPLFQTCPKCDGRGRTCRTRCALCDGFGLRQKNSKRWVSIKAGTWPEIAYSLDIGTKAQGARGTELNIFVRYHLPSVSAFQVENSVLLCEYPVAFGSEGEEIEFPGLWGWSRIKYSREMTAGSVMVLPGQGLRQGELKLRFKIISDLRQLQKARKEFFAEVSQSNPHYQQQKSFWRRCLTKIGLP